MMAAGAAMWTLVLALLLWAWLRRPDSLSQVFRIARQHGEIFVGVVPLALIAAGFLTPLVPGELVGEWLGGAAGLRGILVATLVGWCIPLPPIVFFPTVAVLLKAGAGIPQMTALVVAWNVFALHRTLALELPVMGRYFVGLRLISSVALPPIAGLLAALIA